MSMSTKDKGLVIGGAVLGLLMGGTAIGATGASPDDTGEFFKYSDVKTSYTLAASGEEDDGKKCGDKDSKCGEKDSKCGEKDSKCGEKDDDKGCGEASCG